MQTLVSVIHGAIALLVPALFGWMVLRRVIREAELYTLLGGSLALGFVALMALMNELRFLFEMHLAVWFSYKLLLVGALLLAVFSRPTTPCPRFHPAANRWWQVTLILGGAVVCGLFFAIPAFQGLLHDAWWFHYPTAVHLQNLERFPVTAPFAPDDMLFYHFGPDLLAATWGTLLHLSIQDAFALSIAAFAPAGFLLACGLLLRLSRHWLGGLSGATLLYVGGNLRFLLLPAADAGNPLSILQVFNSQIVDGLLKLSFTPSHSVGIPHSLLILTVYRHFLVRPTWPLGAALGLLLGALSLVAEWYFLPLGAALAIGALFAVRRAGLRRHWFPRAAVVLLPLLIAGGWCLFNNSYLAGLFGHYWLNVKGLYAESISRQTVHTANSAREAALRKRVVVEAIVGAQQLSAQKQHLPPTTQKNGDAVVAQANSMAASVIAKDPSVKPDTVFTPPSGTTAVFIPSLKPAPLLPLRFNTTHLGKVPSWESAGSSGGTFVSILSPKFLIEAFPILGAGFLYGLWRVFRGARGLVLTLVVVCGISLVPPVFLDWGFRSTDFLRFFTGAFSFSALLFALLLVKLFRSPRRRLRWAGWVIGGSCLINALGLALVGLSPATFSAVKRISDQAGSLSAEARRASTPSQDSTTAVVTGEGATAPAPAIAAVIAPAKPPPVDREKVLERLGRQAGHLLYPITRGRERAVVLVPENELPPREQFPTWLKLSTLAKVRLPIGWFWSESLYTALYRKAALELDPSALAGLEVRWIIVTNLYGAPSPDALHALQDPARFSAVGTFREAGFYLSVYEAY